MHIAQRYVSPVRLPRLAILFIGSLMLAACAGMPPPNEQIGAARTAVARATTAGGNQFAPAELKTATDKLGRAELAMTAEDYPQAQRLANEAQVDAALAEVRILSVKAQKSAKESQDANRALIEEMGRKTQ